MCESFRPGMTVLFLPSITRVSGPGNRRISSSFPVAVFFPPLMASASTNDGTPFVAIFALCRIVSTDIENLLQDQLPFSRGRVGLLLPLVSALSADSKFSGGSTCGSGRHLFARHLPIRERRRICTMHHRVGILHTHSVGACVVLHNVH